MANIGFTDKQLHVYTRFQDMRRAYEDAHGRTYAPGFLTVLMDAFEQQKLSKALNEGWNNRDKGMSLLDLLNATKDLDGLTLDEIAALDEAIADINERVVIKQSDGALYLEEMVAHNNNAYMTPHKSSAKVFDNRDQATAFLRKCGHEVGNWIIEPI